MTRRAPLLALVGVTAIWGVTFVQVQDAIALYPLFAFLAVRFAISTAVLAPFAWRSLRTLPRSGYAAGVGVGVLLATAYGLQTAGLELTTVASTGFITGPLRRVHAAARARVLRDARAARAVGGRRSRRRRAAAAERRAGRLDARERARARRTRCSRRSRSPRWSGSRHGYDPRALTFLQMATSFVGFTVDRARARRARGAARSDRLGSAAS